MDRDVQNEPELEFIDIVLVVWDDTRVVQCEIGEHIAIASRIGNEWFVGSVNNTEDLLIWGMTAVFVSLLTIALQFTFEIASEIWIVI